MEEVQIEERIARFPPSIRQYLTFMLLHLAAQNSFADINAAFVLIFLMNRGRKMNNGISSPNNITH